MLFLTLPAVHQEELILRMCRHGAVGALRYNTGAAAPYPPLEILKRLQERLEGRGKQLWIDLKGRQLRICHWSYPKYGGQIRLSHRIKLRCPAPVYFRGGGSSEVKLVRGDLIYVDPLPTQALGAGQALNIPDPSLEVEGYLTEQDRDYIQAAAELGLSRFMLSFVEGPEEIIAVETLYREIHPDGAPEYFLKIESKPGLEFIQAPLPPRCHLVAARDDLMTNLGEDRTEMLPALQAIIDRDPEAICASRLFMGLERGGALSMGDLSDLRLMHLMGYRHFMLSDEISARHLEAALFAWRSCRALRV